MPVLEEFDAHEIGPYRLLVVLRTATTGRVVLGTGLDGRLVAITLVDDGLVNDLFRARLRAEIANAARGARTVHVVDGDADASPPWVATGFIPRVSLRAAIERTGPLPETSLLRLADGLAAALEELHDRGLVHGDLTPDTVLLTDIGPLLVDSGVARAAGDRTAAGDLHALGALLVEAGGAELTEIVAACAANEPSPAALRALIGPLPPSARPWPPAVRALAVEESDRIVDLITETGRRQSPAEPLGTVPPLAPPPRPPRSPALLTRVFDAVLVAAVTAFVGWVCSWWVFGDSTPVPLPDHATLVAQSSAFIAGGVRVTWPLAGFAIGIFCTWLVLLITRPRTNAGPWTVLTGLTLLPVALWVLTFAGLEVTLVAVPTRVDAHGGAFIPAVIAAGMGTWLAGKLFPGRRTGAMTTASLVAVGLAVTTGLYFGWYGVVVADVVRLDIAGVPAGCLAGSIVARTLRPIE